MNTKLAEIREQVLGLPEEARETLAFDLLDSLSEQEDRVSESERKLWDQRLDDLKSGRVKGLTLAEFSQAVRRP